MEEKSLVIFLDNFFFFLGLVIKGCNVCRGFSLDRKYKRWPTPFLFSEPLLRNTPFLFFKALEYILYPYVEKNNNQ